MTPQRVRGGGDPSNRWFDVLWAPTGRMDPPVFPWRIAFSSVALKSAALVSDECFNHAIRHKQMCHFPKNKGAWTKRVGSQG